MATGPDQEAIDGFVSLSGLPPNNAIQWLRAHGNDLMSTANAWMDNPTAFPPNQPSVPWDEGPFHSDKTADAQQNQNSFSVHPPDTLNPSVFVDGAPSRPPSRSSNRAVGGLRDIASNQHLTGETEDEQFHRAMAMSLNESQTLPRQETGVTDFGKGSFGPANRDHYDTDKWSMTYPGAHTQEILLNPEPIDRQRQPGAPAFFKPTPSNYRVAALVKILHSIPLAREAFLNTSHTLADYGRESEWWDGTAIKVLRVVNVNEDIRERDQVDLVFETQRLMAFLDETERAYGSTDVLVELLGGVYDAEKIVRLLETWKYATVRSAEDTSLINIFSSKGVKKNAETGENIVSETFFCLTVGVEQHLVDKGMSLYDALDEILWVDNENEVFLEEIGDVFILEVNNLVLNGSGLGVDVPAVWYADRYLESCKRQAKDMRDRKAAVQTELDDIDRTEEKMVMFHNSIGGSFNASSLLAKATAFFQQTSSYQSAARETLSTDSNFQTHSKTLRPDDAVEELKALSERISAKLKALGQVRESARQKLREISQLNTKPTDDPKDPPNKKYTLRGVSTTAQTMYVLEKTKPESDDDMLSTEAKDWQWWKLEYISNYSKPVVTTKVSEADVLEAARTDSRNVVLVYANEHAISYPPADLPPQLHNFVRADNLSFHAELASPPHLTPTKRKATTYSSDPDDDLITQYPRSPPFDRTYDSDDNLDPNPPGYNSSPSPPRIRTINPRPLRPKGRVMSSDDVIPVSLRERGATTSMPLELPTDTAPKEDEGYSKRGQEMQERGGAGGLLGKGGKEGYSLGDYIPEISIEGEDEGEEARLAISDQAEQTGGRKTW